MWAWEWLGESTETQADYGAYRTGPASEGSPETLARATLAKMIREGGGESFAVYTPALIKTSRLSDLSKLEKVGDKIGQIDTSTLIYMTAWAVMTVPERKVRMIESFPVVWKQRRSIM